MKTLMDIMLELRPDVDFSKELHLVSDGILTSFDIVSIVVAIADELGIELDLEEFKKENFESINAIQKMIDRYNQ